MAVNAWNENAEVVRKYVAAQKLPYMILLNGRNVRSDLYNIRGIPHMFLIDRQGKIVFEERGFSMEGLAAIEREIQKALAK